MEIEYAPAEENPDHYLAGSYNDYRGGGDGQDGSRYHFGPE